MNIPTRVELMRVLTEISELQPYIRLGQLVSFLAGMAGVEYANGLADIEDAELLPLAKEHLDGLRRLPPEHSAERVQAHLVSDRPLAAAG